MDDKYYVGDWRGSKYHRGNIVEVGVKFSLQGHSVGLEGRVKRVRFGKRERLRE